MLWNRAVVPQVHPRQLDLQRLQGPVALADPHGKLLWVSDELRALITRMSLSEGCDDALPTALWESLARAANGHAIEWRPGRATSAVLECSRYAVGDEWLVLMKEVSMQHVALSRQLHRQRLEVTGRLVASIAHELRNSVSSIVYSADLLSVRDELPPGAFEEGVDEIMEASRRLQATVDGLLDYARLGPTVSVPVSLREVLTRAQGFLRSYYRAGHHHLRVTIAPDAEWVQGNSIVVEQVFVNLLLNAAEAASEPVTVQVTSSPSALPNTGQPGVCVRVVDDGPGVPESMRQRIFEPFVTGRERGTGLGLTNSREAVESLGGSIRLESDGPGATFAVYLPKGGAS